MGPFLIQTGKLTGLTLGPCVGSHSCCEFITSVIGPRVLFKRKGSCLPFPTKTNNCWVSSKSPRRLKANGGSHTPSLVPALQNSHQVAPLSSCSSCPTATCLLCFAHRAQRAGPPSQWDPSPWFELESLLPAIVHFLILGRGMPVFPENPCPCWERDPRQAAQTAEWMDGSDFSWAQDVTLPWITATYNI